MELTLQPRPVDEEVRTVKELSLARALEECLEALERGEADVDGLAGRYPEAEEDLRPLLKIAQRLRRRCTVGAPLAPEFREQLRERLRSQHPSG